MKFPTDTNWNLSTKGDHWKKYNGQIFPNSYTKKIISSAGAPRTKNIFTPTKAPIGVTAYLLRTVLI